MNPNSKFRLQGIMLASLVFIADQIVKYAMLGPLQLQSRGVIHIISFFDLRYAENRGVSMSFLTADSDGERWALVALTPVSLLVGMTAALIGPGLHLQAMFFVWLAVFVWFWTAGLLRADGTH